MRHAKPNEIRFSIALYEMGEPMKIIAWLTGLAGVEIVDTKAPPAPAVPLTGENEK